MGDQVSNVFRVGRSRRVGALAALLVLLASGEWAGGADRLVTYTSRRYTIHTNLTKQQGRVFADHMDAVFDEYQRRFDQFRPRNRDPMDLYLFRTKQQYVEFLGRLGIDGANTGGIFFVRPDAKGLATWTADRPRSQVFTVLQHEGFHQFAYTYIGSSLPVWVNEGVAQYFEDGIFVRDKMVLGWANARRVEAVKRALQEGSAVDFDQMLAMTNERWHGHVVSGSLDASLMYAQAWSMTYFMIKAKNKKRREAFETYLARLSEGGDPVQIFHDVFGADTAAFRRGWTKFAMNQEPDPLSTAVSRMEFLGQGLQLLHERKGKRPKSIGALRSALRKIQFRMTFSHDGQSQQVSAMDDEQYKYTRQNGTVGQFRVIESSDRAFPPQLTAAGLSPIPKLVWSRGDDGRLVAEIVFR